MRREGRQEIASPWEYRGSRGTRPARTRGWEASSTAIGTLDAAGNNTDNRPPFQVVTFIQRVEPWRAKLTTTNTSLRPYS